MRVHVDRDACLGDGSCVSICPQIFEMVGDTARAKVGEVSEDLEESCREAADVCPVEAIIIDE